MRRKIMCLRSLGMLAGFLLAVAGFTVAQEVHTDYDHNANFSQYHTYSWAKVEMPDPLYNSRVEQDMDKQLQAKGWQRVETGGDVNLTAMGTTQTKTRLDTFYNGGFGGWRWGGFPGQATTTSEDYQVGTLILDMFNASNHNLLWRGVASGTISNDAKNNDKRLESAAEKFFKDFPPKAKG